MMDTEEVQKVLQQMLDDFDEHIEKLRDQRDAVQQALDDYRR